MGLLIMKTLLLSIVVLFSSSVTLASKQAPGAVSLNRDYKFTVQTAVPATLKKDRNVAWNAIVCNQVVNFNKPLPKGLVCLALGYYKSITITKLALLSVNPSGKLMALGEFHENSDYAFRRLRNDYNFVSFEQPFYARYSLRSGDLLIGFDKNNLEPINTYL